MQSQILRTRALSRAATPLLRTTRVSGISQRPASSTATKPGAEASGQLPGGESGAPQKNNFPLYAVLAFIVAFPSFYFYSSGKDANSGRKEIDAVRRSEGTSGEYRDPRDSGVKTMEDKKKKEAAQKS